VRYNPTKMKLAPSLVLVCGGPQPRGWNRRERDDRRPLCAGGRISPRLPGRLVLARTAAPSVA